MSLKSHASLDFVGDVRNDLNGVTQVFTGTLATNHGAVNLTGGYVG